jgi:hypothetical protein
MNSKIITISALLLLVSSVSAQTSSSCSGSGKYCYADVVYQCVNDKPQTVDYCNYKCQNGVCISGAINPDVRYVPPEPSTLKGSDVVFYSSLTIVLTAIVIFYLKLKLRK